MKTLAVLGSINLDHMLLVGRFPKPGETLAINNYHTVAGGKGANQAVAAARSGAKTRFIACVGDDAAGGEMLDAFMQDGIDTTSIDTIADCSTGMATIYVDAAGENHIGIWGGANAELSADKVESHESVIASADILLMQLETPLEGVERAAKIARANNTKVVLNPAPARELPKELLANIDVITPNETETKLLTGIAVNNHRDADVAAKVLHSYGVSTVLITMGKHGLWLSRNGEGKHYPGFVVPAKDTTAAGDTFNGAFMAELLAGADCEDALRFAQAAAALSVTKMGAQSSIPQREQVLAFLELQTG